MYQSSGQNGGQSYILHGSDDTRGLVRCAVEQAASLPHHLARRKVGPTAERVFNVLGCTQHSLRTEGSPFGSSPSFSRHNTEATRDSHLLQQVFRAQAKNLDVAVPVANGKEGRPHPVFRHFPHFQTSNLHPSQLLRAHFLETGARGVSVGKSTEALAS